MCTFTLSYVTFTSGMKLVTFRKCIAEYGLLNSPVLRNYALEFIALQFNRGITESILYIAYYGGV